MKYIFRTLAAFFAVALLFTSCTKEVHVNPAINKVDPGKGAGNEVLTLTGSGLRNVQTITFDLGNVPATFNPNFNTDNAIIFRVPVNANVGDQHIVFTTTAGYQFSVPFTVLAVPSIVSAYPTEWEAGNTVTITGNYLESVNKVTLEGTTETAEVVSASAKQLVVKMPASSVKQTKLVLTNNAGSSTSGFTLINMDQQRKLYTEALGSGMQDWSWSLTSSNSSDVAVSGSKSYKVTYNQSGWGGLSFHSDDVLKISDFSTLSFWVKGGTLDQQIDIAPDAIASGTKATKTITVPSDVWTHFTMAATDLGDVTFQRLNFQMHGPDGSSQTVYFDNVVFVKK